MRRVVIFVEIRVDSRILAQRKNGGDVLVEWLKHGNLHVLSVKHFYFHEGNLVLFDLRTVYRVICRILLQHRSEDIKH